MEYQEASIDEDDALLVDGINKISLGLEMDNRSFFTIFMSTLNYIISGVVKNTKSFNIGVFTIFLSVTFLCLLKSVFDISPIAYLKLTQD